MIGIHTIILALVLATPAIAQVVTCPSTAPTQTITIAGSTTVQPIAIAWGAAYYAQCGATVTVQGGGSSSGAQRVCRVTTAGTAVDIGAMSRAWRSTEATAGNPGYKYQCVIGTMPKVVQIDVAIDSLVVILKKNSLPDLCISALGGLTFAQLRWIFSSYTTTQLINLGMPPSALPFNDNIDGTHLYSELNSNCPATEIKLVGPSSVFDTYTDFLETILTGTGEMFATSTTRPAGAAYSELTSDTATINAVRNDPTGATIGFVSYNAYRTAMTTVSAVSLRNLSPLFVAPTTTTITAGTYPLSRRIYMNVLFSTIAKTKAFIQYGMSAMGTANVIAQGFSPLPTSARVTMVARLLSHRLLCLKH